MKKNILLFSVSILLFFAFTSNKPKKHRVVFQFTNANDTLQQKAFANQLNNLVTLWPNAELEVVSYNHGLDFMMTAKSKQIDAINKLAEKGIKFMVCENTMKRQKVTKDQLLPIAVVVPSGIAEVVEKQEKGWSYIKGGF
jgi:uncharacterized protein